MTKLDGGDGWSYGDLRALNAHVIFTQYDYARLLLQSFRVSIEEILKWAATYEPEVCQKDGLVFLREFFNEATFQELKRNARTLKDAQIFANLLNVTSMLGDDYEHMAHSAALDIANCWNSSVSKAFPDAVERAQVSVDSDGDCFVYLNRNGAPAEASD